MRKLTALLTGLIFGLGLYLSGMTNPAKVLAFLDITGDWDPSLALVMAGALVPSSLAFYVARRRQTSLLGAALQIPTLKVIDRRLVWGSLLFGAGWALAGLCPGPALALLLTGRWQPVVFTLALVAGMLIFARLQPRKAT
ncbi:YeeE/YedE family protein [Pseudomonas syringae]|uniref:DUF6691 family protein n=1 Tax=Pseudomonas syringae TaxID=317 RepID=UPI001F3E2040|nr:DUF6691 family protein [Pseudomonas syringae]MCF5706132.1 YeeE/YedE family protein [Pseudomonas syringae]